MNKPIRRLVIAPMLAMLVLVATPVAADDAPDAHSATPSNPTGEQAMVLVPVVRFQADAAGSDLFDAIQSSHALAHLSKEAPGAPVQLRIYHSVHPSHVDAKNFFSGLLAVGTLGMAPVIMSGEHTMHYEMWVNGQRVSKYEYTTRISISEHLNLGEADATHGLGPDGVIWAKSTVDHFLNDLSRDPAVRALNDEYQMYFGTPTAGINTTLKP